MSKWCPKIWSGCKRWPGLAHSLLMQLVVICLWHGARCENQHVLRLFSLVSSNMHAPTDYVHFDKSWEAVQPKQVGCTGSHVSRPVRYQEWQHGDVLGLSWSQWWLQAVALHLDQTKNQQPPNTEVETFLAQFLGCQLKRTQVLIAYSPYVHHIPPKMLPDSLVPGIRRSRQGLASSCKSISDGAREDAGLRCFNNVATFLEWISSIGSCCSQTAGAT